MSGELGALPIMAKQSLAGQRTSTCVFDYLGCRVRLLVVALHGGRRAAVTVIIVKAEQLDKAPLRLPRPLSWLPAPVHTLHTSACDPARDRRGLLGRAGERCRLHTACGGEVLGDSNKGVAVGGAHVCGSNLLSCA